MSGEALARRFHEVYERLAPQHGYETRADTKAFDPESANGRLMIAVCAELTTQQDSVDVERLRVALECAQPYVTWFRDKHCKQGEASWRDADELDREIDAALSLPITQRDEQASRRAEAALSVAEMLVPFTTHNIGCAVYQQSYASGSPICTCGVEAAREAVTAIRRLSIEQGDQGGGER